MIRMHKTLTVPVNARKLRNPVVILIPFLYSIKAYVMHFTATSVLPVQGLIADHREQKPAQDHRGQRQRERAQEDLGGQGRRMATAPGSTVPLTNESPGWSPRPGITLWQKTHKTCTFAVKAHILLKSSGANSHFLSLT